MTDHPIETTADLRRMLLRSLREHEAGLLTNAFVRAQAFTAREILDTVKVEIMASRIGLKSFSPVRLDDAASAARDVTPKIEGN